MNSLQNKAAIITGAGRGLGRDLATVFAREGAAVALISRSAAPLNDAVAAIKASGGRAIGIACDVTNAAALTAAIKQSAETFGTIDILINNAHDTAVHSMTAPFAEASVEQMLQQFHSGPLAAVLATQAALPWLRKQGGSVINMGSSVGVKGYAKFLPYAMAKEAMRAMTRVAARELAEFGIRVNTICPAADTDGAREAISSGVLGGSYVMPPIARIGSPQEDIAPLICFLCGDGARYITGYTYMLDGGGAMDAAR